MHRPKHFLSGHRTNAIKTTTRVTRNKNMRIMAHIRLDYGSSRTRNRCLHFGFSLLIQQDATVVVYKFYSTAFLV